MGIVAHGIHLHPALVPLGRGFPLPCSVPAGRTAVDRLLAALPIPDAKTRSVPAWRTMVRPYRNAPAPRLLGIRPSQRGLPSLIMCWLTLITKKPPLERRLFVTWVWTLLACLVGGESPQRRAEADEAEGKHDVDRQGIIGRTGRSGLGQFRDSAQTSCVGAWIRSWVADI